jgi:predicted metal-dependent HD superfamily phosphohydrolase
MSAADFASWAALWRSAGAKGDPNDWHGRLVALYSEPNRHYHNLRHLSECLAEFDAGRHLARNPLAVELALWFHDSVYDTRAKDNEERSAALARECLLQAGLADRFGNPVTELILATKHAAAPNDPDAALLTDIDLSILGREQSRFQEYETQIRAEYHWVPAEAFAAGRGKVLEQFLKRPHIYATDFFSEKYERQARANVEASLNKLKTIS